MTEILDELPKLSDEQRLFIVRRLHELGTGIIEESPEILAAIDEADASSEKTDLTAEEVRANISRWANTK